MGTNVPVRIALRATGWYRRQLHKNVGILSKLDRRNETDTELIVLHSLEPAHMVEDQPQTGVALGNFADILMNRWRIHHDRDVHLLGDRPEPVGRPIPDPALVILVMEGQPHALRARPSHEILENLASF